MKKSAFFLLILALLFPSSTAFAERDSDYHVKLGGGWNGLALSGGFSQWTLASVNFHEDLTYIHSRQFGNTAGIDLSAGIFILNLGVVTGYNNGNSKNHGPHVVIAAYPEIQIPITGYHEDIFEFGIRHYFSSDGAYLTTVGFGYSWKK